MYKSQQNRTNTPLASKTITNKENHHKTRSKKQPLTPRFVDQRRNSNTNHVMNFLSVKNKADKWINRLKDRIVKLKKHCSDFRVVSNAQQHQSVNIDYLPRLSGSYTEKHMPSAKRLIFTFAVCNHALTRQKS